MAEVLVEGRRLDVMEGLDFSFNYSVADVRDPNKRSTDYTKTIKCPSTKNNDLLFGNIWSVNIANPYDPNSVNIEANFNPNKKADASVIQDGVEVMRGVVQLRSITVEKGAYQYEVVFIGQLTDFFSVLGNKKLREIDFSDLDHEYDYAQMVNSWQGNLDYVYPMIDYGDDFEASQGLKIWRVRQFKPALFVKAIVDRIFSYAGFTYTSTFLNSAPFTNLIIPFSGETLYADNSQVNNRKFKASQSAVDGAYTSSSFFNIGNNVEARTLRLNDDSTGDNFDTGNNWNTTTWVYDVPADGYYSFFGSASVNLTRSSINTNVYGGALDVSVQIIRTDTNLVTTVIGESIQPFTFSGSTLAYNETLNISVSVNDYLLLDGDKIQFRLVLNFNPLSIATSLGATLPNSTLFTDFDLTTQSAQGYNEPSNIIFEGDTLNMNSVIPDVTMRNIMVSIFNMFNLYITVNEGNSKNLVIETRDEYYAGGTTRDWTYKLARDRKTEIHPLAMLSARTYEYKYQEDNDYYNERFQTTYAEPYGTRRYEVDNDFLNDKKEVEVIFSPTPMQIDGNSNRFVARIYDNDISEGADPTDSNVRILYYQLLSSSPNWQFKRETNSVLVSQNQYPYAGHLDNPLTPTLDINFGIPDELYYQENGYTGTIQYTNANLFNLYHRKHIEEITDKDSKMLKGHFYLDAWDIQKLDFRDQILIDNTYWRLNKVSDYNPFKEGLTKVELFKVLDITDQPTEVVDYGDTGTTVGTGASEEAAPVSDRKLKQLSAFNSYAGKVNGRQNTVSPNAFHFKVVGDNNFIGDGSRNITIVGDGNYVSSNLENVVIINSDNQEVYESNTTIIDGKRQWQYIDKTSAYTARDRDYVLADASGGSFTVTLSTESSTDHWIAVKKTDSSANAVTIAPDSGTIDGSASVDLVSQYDSVDFYSDGTNWHIR